MSTEEAAPTRAGPPEARGPRIRFLVIGLAVAVALGIGLFTSIGAPSQSTPTVGSTAPAFSLRALGGGADVGTPTDGGGGGRPAVLVFFASWCGPCQSEIPAIASAYRAQGHGRVEVIGVDGMDPTDQALAFVHRSGVSFPVAADTTYRVTEGLYGFDGDPDAVFIDGKGTIERIVHGPITRAELLSWERQLR